MVIWALLSRANLYHVIKRPNDNIMRPPTNVVFRALLSGANLYHGHKAPEQQHYAPGNEHGDPGAFESC